MDSINFANRGPNDKGLELGGGDCPVLKPQCQGGPDVCIDARMCHTAEGKQAVDFVVDLNEPLPIGDQEFTFVFSKFCLEHISFRKVRQLLKEIYRVLKPNGNLYLITPNTEAQLKWIQDNPEGWDGHGLFDAASEVLFGSQTYAENAHLSFFSPIIMQGLLVEAGFRNVVTSPWGERSTDMVTQAVRPQVPEDGWQTGQGGMYQVVSGQIDTTPWHSKPEKKQVQLSDGDKDIHPIVSGLLPLNPNCQGVAEVEHYADKPAQSLIGPNTVTSVNSLELKEPTTSLTPEQLSQEANDWDTGKKKPTDPGWLDVSPGTGMLIKLPQEPKLASGSLVPSTPVPTIPPEQLYDRAYFNGGGKVGGYAREGLWDYPVHEITARHVLARQPKSVLELGAARGYIGKRIEDAGVYYCGMEVSKHCYLTRVVDRIIQGNLCDEIWPGECRELIPTGAKLDLCFSIAVLEHIPEQRLPKLIDNMARNCKRGLHGIDFGEHDDGFDKTHVSLFPRSKWLELFEQYAPGWPVEIVDKEDLERGQFPEEVLRGDGKVKLNLGCYATMYHHGWVNVDIADLAQFANAHKYNFIRADLRAGIPFSTQTVDLLHLHHMLEHFNYVEGLQLLRDCRRVLKPTGAMRIAVPDAELLMQCYVSPGQTGDLSDFDEINPESAAAPTAAGKLYVLLHAGHACIYDWDTLSKVLEDAGFHPILSSFRDTKSQPIKQLLRESVDMSYGLSLFVDAVPKLG